MCDPCNVIPLLPIYYIPTTAGIVYHTSHDLYIQLAICGMLLWFDFGQLFMSLVAVIAAKMEGPVKWP